jgi:hypothetical protein
VHTECPIGNEEERGLVTIQSGYAAVDYGNSYMLETETSRPAICNDLLRDFDPDADTEPSLKRSASESDRDAR